MIFTELFSYCARCLSYCAISYFSLLKCYWAEMVSDFVVFCLYLGRATRKAGSARHFLTLTASKLIKESTATVAALLSAWLASRRNRVLFFTRKSSWDFVRSKGMRANLHEVVLTVNQVYATIVIAVIAAKSHPNLYV